MMKFLWKSADVLVLMQTLCIVAYGFCVVFDCMVDKLIETYRLTEAFIEAAWAKVKARR